MTTFKFTAKRFKALATDLNNISDKGRSEIMDSVLWGWDPHTGGLSLINTDSYILYQLQLWSNGPEDVPNADDFEDATVVNGSIHPWMVPVEPLNAFARGLKVSSDDVYITFAENNTPPFCQVRSGDLETKIACVEGNYPKIQPFFDDYEQVSKEAGKKSTEQLPVAVAPRFLKRLGSLKLQTTEAPMRMLGSPPLGDRQHSGWELRPTYFSLIEDDLDLSVILMPVRIT